MPKNPFTCVLGQCENRATCIPVLVFRRNNSSTSIPNRARIKQQMCDRCRTLVGIHTFLTPSALDYYRAVYAKNGITFPPVSAISLEWEAYHPTLQDKPA